MRGVKSRIVGVLNRSFALREPVFESFELLIINSGLLVWSSELLTWSSKLLARSQELQIRSLEPDDYEASEYKGVDRLTPETWSAIDSTCFPSP